MRIQVTIEGQTALLLNKFTDAAAEASTSGTRGSSAGGDRGTPLEQAETKLYRGLKGELVVPQPNLLRCIVEGGRFHKIGRKQITTARESMIYACLDIEGTVIPIVHREPWRVATHPVRIPSTGGRILCHRPMFDDWSLSFECDLDTELLGLGLFRSIVDDAGKRVGLGDWRPACKGPHGKFKVVSWAVEREQSDALKEAA